jgi:hypothetical protein
MRAYSLPLQNQHHSWRQSRHDRIGKCPHNWKDPVGLLNQVSHIRCSLDGLKPFRGEVFAVEIIPTLVQSISRHDVSRQTSVRQIQRHGLAGLLEDLNTRAEFVNHPVNYGLQTQNTGSGEEGVLWLTAEAVMIVVNSAEVAFWNPELRSVVLVLVSWLGPRVESLVVIRIVNVKFIRTDTDDGT